MRSFQITCLLCCMAIGQAKASDPLVSGDVVFEERDGVVAVEAEHFFKQSKSGTRKWYLHNSAKESAVDVKPDGDPNHVAGASGGAYLEILPDTRRTHADKLTKGENFSNEPGKMGILHYKIHFQNVGKYYVWVRAYSSGSEDNGIHVGLDGKWPESGQRMQWCQGKNSWRWESKQRTEKQHCGVPQQIFLDIKEPGEHEVMFSMREDGFEFDRFMLTQDRDFERPSSIGPNVKLFAGNLPTAFTYIEPEKTTQVVVQKGEPTPAPKIMQKKPAKNDTADAAKEDAPKNEDRKAGNGAVKLTGDEVQGTQVKLWHKMSLTLDGPYADEQDTDPNPFTDFDFTVTFQNETANKKYTVPGFFAADGNAANSSASAGTKWRVHFVPDAIGTWQYVVSLRKGKDAAIGGKSRKLPEYSRRGEFEVVDSDKTGRDFRAQGRLTYVGEHYLKFAGSGRYFIKAGPDAPETLLAYEDFDGTVALKKNVPLKTWAPHVADWKEGDPTWKGGQGKGLIGALNYLAAKGCNSFSFLPYNAGGDGNNIWPFVERDDKFHYDCSKLDQWGIVFDHGTSNGLYLHFKLQENEIDDDRKGHNAKGEKIPESLDGGKLGRERKLYCREIVARFGHALALNWNIGEENTQSAEEQRDMIRYLQEVDPYDHNIVIHTFPDQQDKVYPKLLGRKSLLTGASLQNSWDAAHARTLKWREASAEAGRPWVVCNDEQNPASDGVPPDPGYEGHDGYASKKNGEKYNLDDVRKKTLWGTLMAGGAGVEYYFGYKLPQNDLVCQDFRSRDKSWDYCRIAIEFFNKQEFPLNQMNCIDHLLSDSKNYCFAKTGEIYLVYLPSGGGESLPVSDAKEYKLQWFNPRTGEYQDGELSAGKAKIAFEAPNENDWLAILRK